MTASNSFLQFLFSRLFWKRALQGAGLAFVLVVILMLTVGAADRGTWMLLPMLTVPVGGALGGAFFHLTSYLREKGGWSAVLGWTAAIVIYAAGLWMSLVGALAVVGLWD